MMSFKNCIRIRIAIFWRPAYYFGRLPRFCEQAFSLGDVILTGTTIVSVYFWHKNIKTIIIWKKTWHMTTLNEKNLNLVNDVIMLALLVNKCSNFLLSTKVKICNLFIFYNFVIINPLPSNWSYMINLITLILRILKDHGRKIWPIKG